VRLLLVCAASLGLPACSTIQSWFPDKQKEYRYSSEIPPLEIPPDLVGSSLGVEPPEQPAADDTAETAATEAPQQGAPREYAVVGKQPPAPEGVEQTAELIRDDKGAHIQIETSFAETWTMVEKALNRLTVEIKDRDRSQKVFYVYFSGEVRKAPERSWLSDLGYMFTGRSGGGSDEQEYRVHLEDAADTLTTIRVTDAAGDFQAEGETMKLLQALHERIRNLSTEGDEKERDAPAADDGGAEPDGERSEGGSR
jgi:uncharacterized lipoprotein